MIRRAVLVMTVVAVGLGSVGCAGSSNARPTPTSPTPEQNVGSGDAIRTPQPPRPDPPPTTGTCVAGNVGWAVGQPASRALLERARVQATASVARFIRPNEAITMEYSPARLNLYLDARDVVHSVTCG